MKVKGFVLVGVLLAHLTMFAQQNGSYVQSGYREKIDLSGKWLFQLDPDSTLKPTSKFNDIIYLPGTTDTNRKGNAATKKDETTHLTRKYSYVGKAWYQVPVRIPKSWKGQQIVLYSGVPKAIAKMRASDVPMHYYVTFTAVSLPEGDVQEVQWMTYTPPNQNIFE